MQYFPEVFPVVYGVEEEAGNLEAAEAPPTEFVDNPWYIYECLPFLKNMEGFPEPATSDPKHNQGLVDYIRYANQKPLELVQEFVTNKKSDCLADNKGQGFISKCYTGKQCCPTPFQTQCDDGEVCYTNFFSCDGGRCIPESWVNDDWPDCFDGSDETNETSILPQQLVCVQCAGVVLSAGFVCRESETGLTNECVHRTMGKGGACNQCVALYLNLP